MILITLPALYAIAGSIVSVQRYGNTDASVWKRFGVAIAWPLFVQDFSL